MSLDFHSPPTPDTTAYRLYDGGQAQVDAFAGHWLVQTAAEEPPAWLLDEGLQPGQKSLYWKQLDKEVRESPVHVLGEELEAPFAASEQGVNYEIDFSAGYSQGIFLDQRLNRQRVRDRVSSGDRVMNTFAYTCAFSVTAALGGAVATSVDLSRNYLEWGKRNFQLNDLDPAEHYFTKGDTFDWLRRWAKSGTSFDGVILDPPTFSRNDKGKVFRVEDDYGEMLEMTLGVLNPDGWILCATNCRSLSPRDFESMLRSAAPSTAKFETLSMPPEFDGEQYLKGIWIET